MEARANHRRNAPFEGAGITTDTGLLQRVSRVEAKLDDLPDSTVDEPAMSEAEAARVLREVGR